MVSSLLAFYQHIVNVNLYGLFDLALEHLVDESLINGFGTFKFERHHFIAVKAPISNESNLDLFFFMHKNLILTQKCIHKFAYRMTCHGIQYGVYIWNRVPWGMPYSTL